MSVPSYLRRGIYAVTDDAYVTSLPVDVFLKRLRFALRGGVSAFQLRLKNSPTGEMVKIGHACRSLMSSEFPSVPLFIDDRLDVALAVKADGLHIGGADIPLEDAARLCRTHGLRLGYSCYSDVENMKKAAAFDVIDYVAMGVFASPTKPGGKGLGLSNISSFRSELPREDLGLVAIGGIDIETAGKCITAGADSVSVVRAIWEAGDDTLEECVRHLTQAVKEV